jgi:hypothetical protein
MRNKTNHGGGGVRKLITTAALSGLVVGLVAATAAAKTTTTFSVVTLTESSHPSGHSIIVRSKLVKPAERSDVIGHGLARFTPLTRNRVRARIVFYFADGSLKVKGVFGPKDNRLTIVGGTGRWSGAGGEVKLHNAGHGAERYTFTVVQS